jgi:hypothetical protein
MGGFTARISRDHVPPRPARLCGHRRPVVPVPVSKWRLSLFFSLSLFHLLNARVLMMNSLFVLPPLNGDDGCDGRGPRCRNSHTS